MLAAILRFMAKGWVDELYVDPSFHFSYLGFDWVKSWPRFWMWLHFAALGACALALAVGFMTRGAAALFCLLFTYVELIDKATYLNHYYLVSLLAFLLVFIPTSQKGSWRFRALREKPVAADPKTPLVIESSSRCAVGWYWLLQAQIAIVYWYAGFAKLNADWLLWGEPLSTWLKARSHFPLLGPWFREEWVALLVSWGGAIFDLSVPFLLWFRRTRPYAVVLAVLFHGAIWLMFPVGMFSFVMLVAITTFFDPGWPRRWSAWFASRVDDTKPSQRLTLDAKKSIASKQSAERLPGIRHSWPELLALAYLSIQLLVPLRFTLYPGPVNWTEQGFRFSWRVMLVEKAGQVEFRIATETPAARFVVLPRKELTPLQYRMMATQPDMIQEYAHHLRERFERQGYSRVHVYADAWVAFNGRPSTRLIDPEVDLAGTPLSMRAKPWILAPSEHSKRPRDTGATLSQVRQDSLNSKRGSPRRPASAP